MNSSQARRSPSALLVTSIAAGLAALAPGAFGQVSYTVKKLGAGHYPLMSDEYNRFSRIEFGQLTVDSMMDAAVLLGNEPLYETKAFNQWGPGSYDGVLQVSWGTGTPTFHDVAVVPKGVSGTPGNKGLDLTVYATSNGLTAVYYDLDLQAYQSVAFLPALGSVSRLACGKFAGAVIPDIVAYLPATQELCIIPDVRMSFSGGVSVLHGTVQTISLGAALYDLEALNFVSGPIEEIAVATSTGVRVLSASGSTIMSEATYNLPTTQLTDLRYGTNFPEERLAIVWEKVDGTFSIVEWRNGSPPSSSVDLGWTGIVGIDAGEFDPETPVGNPTVDYPDIAFSLSSTREKKLIYNNQTVTPFHPLTAIDLNLEPVPPGTDPLNRAEPKFCDIDNDGDEDVVIGWRNPETNLAALYIVYCTKYSAFDQTPRLTLWSPPGPATANYGYCHYDNATIPGYNYDGVPPTVGVTRRGTVTLYLTEPTTWPIGIINDWNQTRVEYFIWELDDANSGANATNYARGLVDIAGHNPGDNGNGDGDGNGTDDTPWNDYDNQLWSFARFAIDDDLGDTSGLEDKGNNDMYGVEVRLVKVNYPTNRNTVLLRGPTYLRVISLNSNERVAMLGNLGMSQGNYFDLFGFTEGRSGSGWSYGANFDIDVIQVGCLGIKNGGPTNPFAN